jgi:hypothetical protein
LVDWMKTLVGYENRIYRDLRIRPVSSYLTFLYTESNYNPNSGKRL